MTAKAKPVSSPHNPAAIVTLEADDDPGSPGWIGIELDTVAGNANCRVRRLRSEGAVTKVHRAALFTAQPCTFHWNFDNDESWIVLSGRATVTFDTGVVLELVPGTIASVAAGRSSTWVVHAPIRKFLVVSSARGSNA